MGEKDKKYYPSEPYTGLKQKAIRDTYRDLSPDEKVLVDRLLYRVLDLHIRNMGIVSALEIVGSIAITLVENPQLK
ncbi:MAG: hypothetical protein G01um10147_149 [Microgenomates group bacterium Gr01-1014_7]|nr:MAG: hypothetical protein G01um10147_149 [Microgenomates group bacterium Gr01-1014_7]